MTKGARERIQRAERRAPDCPECGARMQDLRSGKTNPKAPDFRCSLRGCTDGQYRTALWVDSMARNMKGLLAEARSAGVVSAEAVRRCQSAILEADYGKLALSFAFLRRKLAGASCATPAGSGTLSAGVDA